MVSPASLATEKPVLSTTGPVPLEFDRYVAYSESAQSTAGPLVILHGLLGSKQEWATLAQAFSNQLRRPVYTLDLRNHGNSPHVHSMTYADMASDVALFLRSQHLQDVTLLGHSMGGKIAMIVALRKETSAISKLIVYDTPPSNSTAYAVLAGYIDGMREVVTSGAITLEQAAEIMKNYEQNSSVIAYILANAREAPPPRPLRFITPLSVMSAAIRDSFGNFPYKPDDNPTVTWDGPTLIIKATQSNLINSGNTALFGRFFPEMRLTELDGPHWVHAVKPAEFKDLVIEFIENTETAAWKIQDAPL